MTLTFTYSGGTGHDVEVQWFLNGVALEDGDGVSGATTTTLTVPDTAEYDGTYYATVVDSTVGCEVQTDPVEVVVPNVCRLAITEQPVGGAYTAGEDVELAVLYEGEVGTVTFQWYLDGVALVDGASGGATISGATTNILNITSITEALAGDYTVVLTDTGILDCSITSEEAAVTVAAAATNQISLAFWMEMLTQPDPAGADILSNYDFELWDDPGGSMQSRIRLTCAATGGGANTYTFTLTVTEGVLTSTLTTSAIALPLRTWHLVAIVYNPADGGAELFVDTVSVGSTAGDSVVLTTQPYGYLNMTAAAHSVVDYTDSYIFLQDMTGVWVGHGLTGAEQTTLYNGGAGFNGPPWTGLTTPTAWWDFDDAGRTDGTENFVDEITSLDLTPTGSCVQLEGLIDYGVIKSGFARILETDVTATFAYTA